MESRAGEGVVLPRMMVPPSACQERHVRGQELNPRHVSNEARAFEPLVEQRLVKRHHVLTPLEMCAVECDEVAVLGKHCSECFAATSVPPSMHCWYKART